MTSKKGGYQIIDVLNLTYAMALACVNCGKPVLVINDADNTPYFADSIVLKTSNGSVYINKDEREIIVNSNNQIVYNGNINERKMNWIISAKSKTLEIEVTYYIRIRIPQYVDISEVETFSEIYDLFNKKDGELVELEILNLATGNENVLIPYVLQIFDDNIAYLQYVNLNGESQEVELVDSVTVLDI